MKRKYNNLWKTSYMLLKWPLLRKEDLFPLRTSLCFWNAIILGENCVLSWHCLHNHRTNLILVNPPDNRCNPEECWNRGSSLHGNILCQAIGKSSEGSSRGLLNSVCIKYLIFLETLPPKISSQYPGFGLLLYQPMTVSDFFMKVKPICKNLLDSFTDCFNHSFIYPNHLGCIWVLGPFLILREGSLNPHPNNWGLKDSLVKRKGAGQKKEIWTWILSNITNLEQVILSLWASVSSFDKRM